MIPTEILAIGAAFCYASGAIAAKFATVSGRLLLGLLFSLGTGVAITGVLATMTVDSWTVPIGTAILFAAAGLAGPGAGRFLLVRAVRDVGTSVAVPLHASSYPLFATVVGITLLGETVRYSRLAALLLIVTGIWACIHGGSANQSEVSDVQVSQPGLSRVMVLLWPCTAAGAFVTADTFRKFALAQHGDPIVGAFLGLLTAFVIWLTIFLVVPGFREPLRITRSLGWFCVSGVFVAVAQLSLLFALRTGDISMIAPIIASQPVIVVILGALLLRNLEKLRLGTVLGAVIVFFGVAYLSVA